MAIDSTVRWFHSGMAGAPQIQSPWTGTLISIMDACLINGLGASVADLISVTDEVATVTFATNNFERHAVINVQGIVGVMSGLNGDWRITTSDATTFTFDCPGVPNGTALSVGINRATPGSWEKRFYDAGTNTAVYRSTHEDASGCHFRIYDGAFSTSRVDVRGYETMSDINTGIRPFPNFTQAPATQYQWKRSSSSSGNRPWVLVADHMFFWFFIFQSVAITPLQATMYHFGDVVKFNPLDTYPTVIVAHDTTSTSTFNAHTSLGANQFVNTTSIFTYDGCWWARPSTNDAVDPGVYIKLGNIRTSYPGDGAPFPHPATGGYMFHYPVAVAEVLGTDTVERGFLPGGMQGLTDNVTTLELDDWRLLNPSAVFPRAIMLVATSGSTGTTRSYFGVDIFGPWR